ncbi:MAG TPA: tyrosine-type recombinase/integrase [Solirubrobacterales bacterium]|nr:tyrosine-type recombinase/integrase [Solirubrobacterales bacterium]
MSKSKATQPKQKKPKKKRDYGTGCIFEHNGSETFKFRPATGGRQVQKKVCRVGAMTTTEINRRCSQIEAEHKPIPEQPTGVPTVAQVGKAHIRKLERDGKAKSYTKGRRRYLRLYVEPFCGEQPVDQPKVKDMERFIDKMQDDEKSADTIVSVLWLFSGIFGYAMRKEWRTDNPVAAVEKPENPNTHPIVHMTPAEVNKVIAHVPDDEWGKVERILYRGGQKTGARRSELLAVRWTDCDFVLDVIRVVEGFVEGEFKKTKGKRVRFVPMVPDYKAELEAWRMVTRYHRDDDLVHANPITGRPLEPSKVTKRFKQALLNAGVGPIEYKIVKVRRKDRKDKVYEYKRAFPVWEFRDLRDTFGTTMMADPEIAPREVQEWLGHRSLTTTSERYGGYLPSTDAAQRMAKAFGRQSSGKRPKKSLEAAAA